MVLVKDLKIEDIKHLNVKLGEISKRQYNSVFNIIRKEIPNEKLKDILKIMDKQKTKIKHSKLRNQMVILSKFYKVKFGVDDDYREVFTRLKKLNKDILERDKGTTIEAVNEFKEVKERLKKMIVNNKEIDRVDLITMYLYVVIAPRRGDMRFMRIYKRKKGPPDRNYPNINVKAKTLYFPPYKTNIPIEINLTEYPDFLRFVRNTKINTNNNKLYTNNLSREMSDGIKGFASSQKAYTLYIKRIFKNHFKVDFTIQKIRRLSASEDHKIIEKLQEKADRQGHSLQIHIQTYAKIEK